MTDATPDVTPEQEPDVTPEQEPTEDAAADGAEDATEITDTTDPAAPTKRRFTVQIIVGAAILVIVGIVVAFALVAHSGSPSKSASRASDIGPKNMASGGVLLTGHNGDIVAARTNSVTAQHITPTSEADLIGTANIVEYVDLQCPYCLQFEITNLSNTASLVSQGKATLEIHPIAILDRSSEGTHYSTRAANAVDCVANFQPNAFLNALAVLYEYQPKEDTSGLTNKQILGYLTKADVSSAAVTKCVNTLQFGKWVAASTSAVENGSFKDVATSPTAFQGTPTVFVNGAQYGGSLTDPNLFAEFVQAEAGK